MLARIEKCMFLDGRKGSFETDRNGNVETVEYQNAEFYQLGEDSGGSMMFVVDKTCPIEEFQRLHSYDLTIDVRQTQKTSGGRTFRLRVVDFVESNKNV